MALVDRRQSAESGYVESLRRMLNPNSIAVIGPAHGSAGAATEVVRQIIAGGFRGPVYPVSLDSTHVAGVPAYGSLEEIPAAIDLVIVATSRTNVLAAVRSAADAQVGGVVVLSDGFAELGEIGRRRQQELFEVCRAGGIRLIGPNSTGVCNTDPAVSLQALTLECDVLRGSAALMSQSGSVGALTLELAAQSGVGVSSYVAAGNKADVSANDLLELWEHDPRTALIMLYVESFGNPERFEEIARRVASVKPIIAVKSGRSPSGRKMAQSHTGHDDGTDDTVDEQLGRAGVLRVDTVDEMIDAAMVFDRSPLPFGVNVGLVSNAGGPAVLAIDAVEANGLQVAGMGPGVVAQLRQLTSVSEPANPVLLPVSVTPAHLESALTLTLEDPNIDSSLVMLARLSPDRLHACIQAVEAAARRFPLKPVVLCVLSASRPQTSLSVFSSPERAVKALALLTRYAMWRHSRSRRMAVRGAQLVAAS